MNTRKDRTCGTGKAPLETATTVDAKQPAGRLVVFHSTVGEFASQGAADRDLRGTAVACPAAGQCFADISSLSQAGRRDYNAPREELELTFFSRVPDQSAAASVSSSHRDDVISCNL